MKLSTQVKPVSYLKSHIAEVIKGITKNREPMLITHNGEAKLVVLDVQTYEEEQETFALLKIFAFGNQEIDQGWFDEAEDAFAELDKADHL